MIGCSEAVRQLWEYLDDMVDAADRASIDVHLARCKRCCGELEFAKHLRLSLAEAAEEDVPADVLERLHGTLEELER